MDAPKRSSSTPRRSAAASRQPSSSTSRISPTGAARRTATMRLPTVGTFACSCRSSRAAPGLLVLGPGSVSQPGSSQLPGPKSDAMLAAAGPGLDAFSYHFYGGVSKRCAGQGNASGQTTPDAALSEDWLSRTERCPPSRGAPRPLRTGKTAVADRERETACGGNPWASTFTDTFRYVEQLGRLAKFGVQGGDAQHARGERLCAGRGRNARPEAKLLGRRFVAATDGNDRARCRHLTCTIRPRLRALSRGAIRRRRAARCEHGPRRVSGDEHCDPE